VYRFMAAVTMSRLPVRSPFPKSVTLDAVGAGEKAELRGGDCSARIVGAVSAGRRS